MAATYTYTLRSRTTVRHVPTGPGGRHTWVLTPRAPAQLAELTAALALLEAAGSALRLDDDTDDEWEGADTEVRTDAEDAPMTDAAEEGDDAAPMAPVTPPRA